MVGYDPTLPDLSQMEVILAGALSGVVTRGVCQPLDVLKIRFQLQTASDNNAKYRNMFQATRVIIQEEGVKALWKGHVSAQLLSIVYGMTQFSSYEFLTKKAFGYNLYTITEIKPLVNFTCGAISGSLGTLTSFPFDVIRTRLIAQQEGKKVYKGILHAFLKIYRNEGHWAFFRGLTPTVISVAPHTGAQFMFYKLFIKLYDDLFREIKSNNVPLLQSMTCGSLAGLCAKTVVYPLDLAKKRLQVQGVDMKSFLAENNLLCKGLVDCFMKTLVREGLRGLFKGLVPSLVKAVFTTAFHFGVYEEVCKYLRK